MRAPPTTLVVASDVHSFPMTIATLHRLAIQDIPPLCLAIEASPLLPTVQRKIVHLLEEKLAFTHLRCDKLPDGRKLIAAIEYGAIAQSLLSAGPAGPHLPYSATLESGDLAGASWFWRAHDSARVADNVTNNIPDRRWWMMFLLNWHGARCEYAAFVLVRLAQNAPCESMTEAFVSRLIILLNNMLFADLDELQHFLSGTPLQILESEASRYRITEEVLLRKRNLLLAIDTHPFLGAHVSRQDFSRWLPADIEDLLAIKGEGAWASIVMKIAEGVPPAEALSSALNVSAEVIISLSGVTDSLLTADRLDRLLPVYRLLPANELPQSNSDFLKILLLIGGDEAYKYCQIFSCMSRNDASADDVSAILKWLRFHTRFLRNFESFSSITSLLLESFRARSTSEIPFLAVSLYSFLGEPTYSELDVMLDAWHRIDEAVRHDMSERLRGIGQEVTANHADLVEVLSELEQMSALLPDYPLGIALWISCFTSMTARDPRTDQEESLIRAFSPAPGRGFAVGALREAMRAVADES